MLPASAARGTAAGYWTQPPVIYYARVLADSTGWRMCPVCATGHERRRVARVCLRARELARRAGGGEAKASRRLADVWAEDRATEGGNPRLALWRRHSMRIDVLARKQARGAKIACGAPAVGALRAMLRLRPRGRGRRRREMRPYYRRGKA